MGRLFIRGDCHGNFDFLPYFCEDNHTTVDDILIILGDAGILYYGSNKWREKYLKGYICNYPITLLCIRGNHEASPEDRGMPLCYEPLVGGEVYRESEFLNILYAIDGGVYRINNKTFLAIGGAYSVDKFYRLANDWYWNPHEQLSQEQMNNIYELTKNKHYDYVLTHTCPFSWQPTDLFLKGLDQSAVDNSMELWLEKLSHNIDFNHWYFGHYHDDRLDICGDNKVTMLFNKILELKY